MTRMLQTVIPSEAEGSAVAFRDAPSRASARQPHPPRISLIPNANLPSILCVQLPAPGAQSFHAVPCEDST